MASLGEGSTRSTVAPMLSVRRGSAAIDFYKAAFGATEIFLIESPDGEVGANLAVAASGFWVADESPDYKNFRPETLGGAATRMVVPVGDPVPMYAQAVKAGASQVSPVEDKEYGW